MGNNENYDKYKENDRVGKLCGNICFGEYLDDTEKYAAQERSGYGADSTENSSRKALIPGIEPVVGVSVLYTEQKNAGDGGQSGTDSECD